MNGRLGRSRDVRSGCPGDGIFRGRPGDVGEGCAGDQYLPPENGDIVYLGK